MEDSRESPRLFRAPRASIIIITTMKTTTKKRSSSFYLFTATILLLLLLLLNAAERVVSAQEDSDASVEGEPPRLVAEEVIDDDGLIPDARELANKILSGGGGTTTTSGRQGGRLSRPKAFDDIRDESVDIHRHEAIGNLLAEKLQSLEELDEEEDEEKDDRDQEEDEQEEEETERRLDSRFEDWLRKFPERRESYCDDDGDDDDGERKKALCPQSFAREQIYLENLRRVERHNEALERGWPTETKLELSVDNQFADRTKSEYEKLMSETGMRKRSEFEKTSSSSPRRLSDKKEEEENVVATKEMKKMTVAASYAMASLGSSRREETEKHDDKDDTSSSSSSSSTKRGIFGKVVEEVDDAVVVAEKDESGPSLEELKQAIADDAKKDKSEVEIDDTSIEESTTTTTQTQASKKTEDILSRQFPEKEREAVNARVIIPKKMQNATGSNAKKFSLNDITDATLDSEFVKFVFKYDKRSEYCGDDSRWPCEVAFQKQDVFLANVKEIDEQNRLAKKRGSHMRKGITRFADLTQDEFEDTHATYVPKEHQEDKAERERRKASKAKKDKIAAEAAAKGGASRKFGKHNHHGLFANKEVAAAGDDEKDDSNAEKDKTTTSTTTESMTKEEFVKDEEENREAESVESTTDEKEEEEEEESSGSSPSSSKTSSSSHSSKKASASSSKKSKKATAEEKEKDEEVEAAAEEATAEEGEKEEEKSKPAKKRLSKEERKEQEERAKKMTPEEIKKARKANKLKNAKQGIARELPQLGEITKDENLKKKVVDKYNFQNENESEEEDEEETSNNVIDVQIHEFNDPNSNTTTFKKHLDWRNKIDIGPVYSQGACSGCWAYSTVQVIADSKAINTGSRPDLSPYHLLSCDTLDSGCHTGNMATAYAWIGVQRDGILRSRDFSTDITPADECPLPSNLGSNGEIIPDSRAPKPRGIGIDGYCEIAPLEGKDTILALMRAVKQQPIAVGLNVKPLQLYGGGLVQVADCPPASMDSVTAINHAAVIVGWGMDEAAKKPYWLIKNSYGVDWGEDGYARIAMELTEGGAYGACGLYSEQNYPLTDGNSCAEGSDKRWSEIQGSDGDVYLMPDYVLVLPNGGGLLTPAKFTIFGHDVTNLLKYTSVFCFVSCVALILMEIAQCIHPEIENWGSGAGPARDDDDTAKETLLAANDDDANNNAKNKDRKNTYGTSDTV